MLDLATLQRIKLSPRPFWQRLIGHALTVNYLPVKLRVDGFERLPDEPVIYAMNHTDRYNYWPFQYKLWKSVDRYIATWVKGKYYENRGVAAFMEATNNLPTVSRGYIITRDIVSTLGRRPSNDEYRTLRAWVDGAALGDDPPTPAGIPEQLLTQRRAILGRTFDPGSETYPQAINALFREMMALFVGLHDKAFGMGLDLLVFPQGTRSKRLSRGRIGLAEVALHYRKTVVPVGCNGCDGIYPGSSPFARPGKVTYRIGQPIPYEAMAQFHISEPFQPFSAADEAKHRDKFQGYVDVVMDRINELLDPEYQFSDEKSSEGVAGSDRFV